VNADRLGPTLLNKERWGDGAKNVMRASDLSNCLTMTRRKATPCSYVQGRQVIKRLIRSPPFLLLSSRRSSRAPDGRDISPLIPFCTMSLPLLQNVYSREVRVRESFLTANRSLMRRRWEAARPEKLWRRSESCEHVEAFGSRDRIRSSSKKLRFLSLANPHIVSTIRGSPFLVPFRIERSSPLTIFLRVACIAVEN